MFAMPQQAFPAGTIQNSTQSHGNVSKRRNMSNHKVRTYKEYHSVCPSSELGLSQPLSRQRVCPSPPETGGRGHTSLRVGGWGESQFRRGAYTVVLLYVRTLCVKPLGWPRKLHQVIFSLGRLLCKLTELASIWFGKYVEKEQIKF
jgi:hypothetical protein